NTGSLIPGDQYQPKGYVVEYGGMPGEVSLQMAASTKITIPEVILSTPSPVCDSGVFTLTANAAAGQTISWYDSPESIIPLGTGDSFTTPLLSSSTTYYADAGCQSNRQS